MIKKEQFQKLKPFENFMKQAKSGYIHGIYYRDATLLNEVYTELGYHLENPNCAHCVLTMCKILSREYFKYIDRYGKKKPE